MHNNFVELVKDYLIADVHFKLYWVRIEKNKKLKHLL